MLRVLRSTALPGFVIIFAASALCQNPAPRGDAVQGAPVELDGKTLFTVRTGLGPFTAEERAAAANDRLSALSRDLTVPVDAVRAAPSDASTDIVARDRVLLTVTDGDAQAAGQPRSALAAGYVARIREAVTRRRADYSYRSMLLGAGYTAGATLGLILLLWGIRSVFPALCREIEGSRGRIIRSIRFQRAELISAERLVAMVLGCLKVLRIALVLVILYLYVPLVLSFFPWTREYTPVLFGYIVNPLRSAALAFGAYLPDLIVVIIAMLIAWACTRVSRFFFDQLAKGTITWPGFFPEWASPTYKILRFLILAFTAVVIFPYLPGSTSPAFRGISIFLGVLFSLGSTSAVANVVAGTILTYTRAFRLGDRVRIADTVGDVVEKTLLATRVRTIKNEMVTVPNAMVLGSHITNFSAGSADGAHLILHTTVTIGYDAPWRTVHELLIDAALQTSGILSSPRPFVLQTALDDFYVHYQVNAYTNEPARMALIYAELHQNIQDAFNQKGVEIMSPHFSSLRDGNRKAIPDPYLPDGYAPPPFHVNNGYSRASSSPAGGNLG